ncbi:cyclic nucleotide-gated ion channel 1 [Quercus suber]|uniref:Cyclic nucleotide-gated ion channel 1 n=1 Tax=Quercus suber TaxID=58331 RepID=A0AAW0L433_QUESU
MIEGGDSLERSSSSPLEQHHRIFQTWRIIFGVSCVIAVSLDPLFFYVPVINEENKCIELDKKLRTISLILRSVTDIIGIINIILQVLNRYTDKNSGEDSDPKKIPRWWLYFLIDILVLLPFPQVIILIIFRELKGSKSLNMRKLLTFLVLFQYVPRVVQIYRSWKDPNKVSNKTPIWVKAAFNFFLYIIASHLYMQLETARTEEERKKAEEERKKAEVKMKVKREKMNEAKRPIEIWMLKHRFPRQMKIDIMQSVINSLERKQDVNVKNLLHHLPEELRNKAKRFLYLDLLKKLPVLENINEQLLLKICDSLKPVYYNEKSYIVREGDPIDETVFITDGIAWSYTTKNDEANVSSLAERLGKGHFFGGELLEFVLKNPSLPKLPVSPRTVKTHGPIEAFTLKAEELKKIVCKNWMCVGEGQSEPFAANVVQAAWRRYHEISVDPLFFYIPVINVAKRCLMLEKKLRIVALVLRTVTDVIYIVHIILQFRTAFIDKVVEEGAEITNRYSWKHFIIDIPVILPIPQVVLLQIVYSEMRSTRSSDSIKWLNALVLFQYAPRVRQIYISWKELTKSKGKFVGWVKAAFIFFLYILSSHVIGAFWYFFSIERETVCWHKACKNQSGCGRSSFSCAHSGNYTFLDDLYPINAPNSTLFDFGIFLEALQSGVVQSSNLPTKFFFCFWWGLRNLRFACARLTIIIY